MSRTRIRAVAILAAVVTWWGAVPAADATVMVEVPIEDMAESADAIVVGVVESSGTRMVIGPQGQEPRTITKLRVSEWLKGPADAEEITLREIGGSWKGGGMRIDGTPTYERGEEVLLFLKRHPDRPDVYKTHQMIQGKFIITRGAPGVPSTVRRDLDAVAFARWTDDRMTVEHGQSGPRIQLEELLRLVRRVVGTTARDGREGEVEGTR
ncbi:MAG: hypothetical protein ACOCUS_03565 [Polyangiales bacterium]